jgi:organic radical activating enzyme
MAEPTAPLVEIFSGIQGEGIFVGARHLFVRFAGCNRACRFCDTPESRQTPAACAIGPVGPVGQAGQVQLVPNPLSVSQVLEAAVALDAPRGLHEAVSLTGGEPLCHAAFLAALCPRLRETGFATYLETNGTLPDALALLVGCLDHVAMDIKLASATGEPTDWEAHRRFLALCPSVAAPRRGADASTSVAVQVKIIVASATTDDELERVTGVVGSASGPTPVVLQPVTPLGGVRPPSPDRLLAMQQFLRVRLRSSVRVIPQLHKLMGQK